MKENMLDVLFYLFENYSENQTSEDKTTLQNYLINAGFQSKEVTRAFDWLEKLAEDANTVDNTHSHQPIRVFSANELRWLNTDCRGHILFLEQAGILDATLREQIIDQVVALEDEDFNLDKLKWVILMIMLNRKENAEESEEDAARTDFLWLDSITTDREREHYH
jgi:Smg protein